MPAGACFTSPCDLGAQRSGVTMADVAVTAVASPSCFPGECRLHGVQRQGQGTRDGKAHREATENGTYSQVGARPTRGGAGQGVSPGPRVSEARLGLDPRSQAVPAALQIGPRDLGVQRSPSTG